MKELEKLLKVLADKNRLRILKLLEKRKMCVCELALILGITQPSISRHLKKLKSAGLVGDEQEGFWTNYFLSAGVNSYAKVLMLHLHGWLNDDLLVRNDSQKARKIDRNELCRRG